MLYQLLFALALMGNMTTEFLQIVKHVQHLVQIVLAIQVTAQVALTDIF